MAPRDSGSPMGVTRKFPTNRDKTMGTVEDWLLGKEADDGAEGLWRIHDKLYDLTTFVTRHPGGRDWIQLTRGTDITEAFEVHHLSQDPEKLLPKFFVREAKSPRNSLVTFKEDGFYKTLKKRIQNSNLQITGGTTIQSKLLTDSLVALMVLTAVFGAWWGYHWSIISGVFLHMVVVCSHNFIHMRDNARMYYFNLSLMSYRDWRISHVLSHHLFPNTILDLEISMWEPLFKYMPDSTKSMASRYASWAISPVMFITMFHWQFARRLVAAWMVVCHAIQGPWLGSLGWQTVIRVADVASSRKLTFRPEELSCLGLPLLVFLLSGTGLWQSFVTWNIVILSGSAIFGVVGLTAAHHHPDIYHEGDVFTEDKDFGILQLAAVRDRVEVNGHFFLVMISFGDHALHHMFPTIDHHRLPALYPIFYKTCKEFGIEYKLYPAKDMFTGMYQQLARNYQNAKLLILNKKH